MSPRPPASTGTAAVLAVKRLTDAKTRLAATLQPRWAGVDRGALVLAMMADTIAAVAAAGVERVVVVSPDPAVLASAEACGAVGFAEPAPTSGAAALNEAYRLGTDEARRRWPRVATVLLVQADLPAATGEQIQDALATAHEHHESMVPDHSGRGTALLIRPLSLTEPPLFGPDSAAAHAAAGVVDLSSGTHRWPGIRRDVDTADDLAEAVRLGVGTHTRAALSVPESA